MTRPVWPAPPSPGQPVELPLRAPDTLLAALDYPGDSQYVALSVARGVCLIDDGVTVEDAEPDGWQLFRSHPLVRGLLDGYRLGNDTDAALHRLVVDRLTGRLAIALPDDAARLLASQPRTREALTGDMSPADAARYLDIAAEVAQDRFDAALTTDSWLQYARQLRTAQHAMMDDLNLYLGGRLLDQIRGIATTINDATRRTDPPTADPKSRWNDVDRDKRRPGPGELHPPDLQSGPHPPDQPGPELDLD
ncbi:hypothetical protein ACQEVZ_55725 [Dactylosporangium sp. CA-152071]|uniref:hypothetical protein n=1 Tax=Dactylosporangium sp. CA-152071 TaxID=3239933 RepID=UPI003D8CAEF1